MKNAIKIFTYNETPIYIKYWFFILLLVISPIKVASLFIGVLIHELAHAIEAKKLGYKTDYIFIDVFYGGALIDSKYQYNNLHAIKIAAAGPLSNIILSSITFSIMLFTKQYESLIFLNEYLSTFMTINFILGFSNLLPIYPLDGGRISKGLLNIFSDNRTKARKINSMISLFTTISLITVCSLYGYWILSLFCLTFLYTSYKEWVK